MGEKVLAFAPPTQNLFSRNNMTSRRKSTQKFPVHILVFLAPAVLIYTAFMV
jgi:hypothetical protein